MKCSKILATIAFASLFAASSFAADEEIIGKYGAITIKKVTVKDFEHPEWNSGPIVDVKKTVAYIDDDSKETPVITDDIEVDSVYFTRTFKANTASTLMLPLDVKEAATWQLNLNLYKAITVKKESGKYQVFFDQEHAGLMKANTPYVAYTKDNEDVTIALGLKNTGEKSFVLNTTTNNKVSNYKLDGYYFNFTGTYENIEFKNPKGIYGFAGVNADGKKVGDFVHVACKNGQCASVRPFRAYLKIALTSVNKSASDEDVELPETIEVYLVDSDKKGTTYIGLMNTSTGEIVKEDNRWFDMKGRVLDHKPTAKGTYYNNKKKVIIK